MNFTTCIVLTRNHFLAPTLYGSDLLDGCLARKQSIKGLEPYLHLWLIVITVQHLILLTFG